MEAKQDKAPPKHKGWLKVEVCDKESRAPLVGATIALYPANGDEPWSNDQDYAVEADWRPSKKQTPYLARTDAKGHATFSGLQHGLYLARYENFPETAMQSVLIDPPGSPPPLLIEPDIGPYFTNFRIERPDGLPSESPRPRVDDSILVQVDFNRSDSDNARLMVSVVPAPPLELLPGPEKILSYPVTHAGQQRLQARLHLKRLDHLRDHTGVAAGPDPERTLPLNGDPASVATEKEFAAAERPPTPVSGHINVSLSRTETEATADLSLWTLIRNSTDAMSFPAYQDFIDGLFCGEMGGIHGVERERYNKTVAEYDKLKHRRALPFTDSDAYRVLKAATEAFVMVNCGVRHGKHNFERTLDNAYLDRRDLPDQSDMHDVLIREYLEQVGDTRMLPYLAIIRRKLHDIRIDVPHGRERDADLCFGIIQQKLTHPCLVELIWSYWHEEGMLVQSMNAITRRFQNVRGPGISDALANSEIDMLRPLNNLIWGYTQDEQHRLTVVRRNYEYDHHYGVRLDGKAVRHFRPADSRSKFLEAFHHLLRLATSFYRQDDDTTVKADAFPVLNALKEVHLILSQGAHNQFGDLPSTARIEMLMQQWLLARPEFREFLPTRVMVAYPEPWMDRVDAMKRIQNWTDTSVVHFRSLAVFGEQLLLSIRYGAWSDIYEPTPAFNWARFWRPQVQGYIHAYRAATGVDLSIEGRDSLADATIPAVLLRQRLAEQLRGGGKPAGA
jgi:hypothetical protein